MLTTNQLITILGVAEFNPVTYAIHSLTSIFSSETD